MITINLSPDLESHLRTIAQHARTSADDMVCRIVSDYIAQQLLTTDRSGDVDIPPITRSLIGVIKQTTIDETDYQRYRKDKYG